jgi:LysM repeat protein
MMSVQKIITPVQYNHSMRKVVLIGLLLLAACAAETRNETPIGENLKPYETLTPQAAASESAQLVVTPETPLPSPTPFKYTIKAGDTMGQIAETFHVSLDALQQANPDIDPNGMPVGKSLLIPSNPDNPTGESTPTPAPFSVEQIACHSTVDRGLWCFVLAHNDSPDSMENVTAQVTLTDSNGKAIVSQTALLPLNILPPNQALPLSVFFAPDVPTDVKPQVQILTATRLLPGDERYLPAAVQNTLVRVDWAGLSAKVDGEVVLPASSKPAHEIWVAAIVYDGGGNVIGVRRWESNAGLPAGGSLPFSFMVSSVEGKIERVDFAVEARP